MFESYTASVVGAIVAHPYILLFVGLLFAGETILLPAVYAALRGNLEVSYVVGITLLATTISDIVWYYIGLHMKERFYGRVINHHVRKVMDGLSAAFRKRSATILYLSKFVYGTRVAAQVLSGAERMPFRRYICVNFLGILSLTLFIVIIAYATNATVVRLDRIVHDFEVAFLAFVAVVVLAHLFLGSWLKKLWSR